MPVIYIIVWIVSFILYIVYDDTIILYLFTFLMLFSVIIFVLLKISSKKISIEFSDESQVSVRNNKIPLKIKITNESFLPVGNIKIIVRYTNSHNNEINELKINSPVYPKDNQILKMKVNALHYGKIYFQLESCIITDMIRLFKLKIKNSKKNQKTSITIVPDHIKIDNNITDYSDFSVESNEFSPYKKGNDPSEIFEVREYVHGDRLNRIHWNLSARLDKTIVKEYSLATPYEINILVDMYFNKKSSNYLSLYDALIESVSAISYYLTENSVPHKIILYNERSESINAYEQNSEEDYQNYIYDLVNMEISNKVNESLVNFLDSECNNHCGNFLYFSSNYDIDVLKTIHSVSLAKKNTFVLISEDTHKIKVESIETVIVNPNNVTDSISKICL